MIKIIIWCQVVIVVLLVGGSFIVVVNLLLLLLVFYGVEEDVFYLVCVWQGMVVLVDVLVICVGVDILCQGGNVVDVVVVVGYVLVVIYLQVGNIGGGGFMMLWIKDGKIMVIDFCEMVLEQVICDMFFDDQGNLDSKKLLILYLVFGMSGSVVGFFFVLEKYGIMLLNKVICLVIKLVEEGFIVNDVLVDDLKIYGSEVILQYENSKVIFWKNGELLKKGDWLVQKNFGKSLELIVEYGLDVFYKGVIVDQIVDEMKKYGGLIIKVDFVGYKVVECMLVSGEYCGYEVYFMLLLFFGGIYIVQIFNIFENFDMQKYGFGSVDVMQVMVEVEKYVYVDCFEYFGDFDFVNVLWQVLISKVYVKVIVVEIDVNKVKFFSQICLGKLVFYESNQIIYFLVVDKDGNVVVVIYILNMIFGIGIVVGDFGILFNNQMDDFLVKFGVFNVYGLVGGDVNVVELKKCLLLLMLLIIVVKDGKIWLVIGSLGGSWIIIIVLQMVVNIIDFGMNVVEVINVLCFYY